MIKKLLNKLFFRLGSRVKCPRCGTTMVRVKYVINNNKAARDEKRVKS